VRKILTSLTHCKGNLKMINSYYLKISAITGVVAIINAVILCINFSLINLIAALVCSFVSGSYFSDYENIKEVTK
jgi:hypothetical protein